MIVKCRNIHGSTGAPLIVKLGGSLYTHVPNLVPVLRSSVRPLLIVPGGAMFADAVRQAGLDDETAHWKAIEAMDKFGRHVASHGLPVTGRLTVPDQTVIFLPCRTLHARDPLPHSWDVTSDTIAAWAAAELRLDLLLLKSVDGILTRGVLQEHIGIPDQTDVVDPLFIPYVLEKRVNTFILNGTRPELLARYLRGDRVTGTRISTTF
jgi:5-(aminomethyl)-3-furanmethanol phosphate kinase